MERRLLVIQEHNADKAGLHWDVRFESGGDISNYIEKRDKNTREPMTNVGEKVLRSFVIPKHMFPTNKLLMVIPVEDHPWNYKDFNGVIESGYGKGKVKLIFSDYVNVEVFSENKITFEHDETWYTIFNAGKNFLIKKHNDL